jgi:hypothetical protein
MGARSASRKKSRKDVPVQVLSVFGAPRLFPMSSKLTVRKSMLQRIVFVLRHCRMQLCTGKHDTPAIRHDKAYIQREFERFRCIRLNQRVAAYMLGRVFRLSAFHR